MLACRSGQVGTRAVSRPAAAAAASVGHCPVDRTVHCTLVCCGLDLRASDSGDGPAFFVMFLVLIVTVPLVFLVWALFEPPIWVHMVLWPVVIIGLSLWLLRPAKAIMVALQFKHRRPT